MTTFSITFLWLRFLLYFDDYVFETYVNDYVFYDIFMTMFSMIFLWLFSIIFWWLRFLWYFSDFVFYDIFIIMFSMIFLIIIIFLAYSILIIILDNHVRLPVLTSFYCFHQCPLPVWANIVLLLPSSVRMVSALTITTQTD
jgi:hypothetical protein